MGKRIILIGADFSNCAVNNNEDVIVDVPVSFSWEYDGKYILKETGELTDLSAWKTSEFITIPQGAIAIKGYIYGYSTVANVACYDSSGNYLGGFNKTPNEQGNYYFNISDFPSGTTKVRVCSDVTSLGGTEVTVIFEFVSN